MNIFVCVFLCLIGFSKFSYAEKTQLDCNIKGHGQFDGSQYEIDRHLDVLIDDQGDSALSIVSSGDSRYGESLNIYLCKGCDSEFKNFKNKSTKGTYRIELFEMVPYYSISGEIKREYIYGNLELSRLTGNINYSINSSRRNSNVSGKCQRVVSKGVF